MTNNLTILPSVTLLHNTPLSVADTAISKCWDIYFDEPNLERMHRVVKKKKHASTIEHISYNFEVKDISRTLLIELTRTRIASFSVKSSRYTLEKDLKNEDRFFVDIVYDYENYENHSVTISEDILKRASKYLTFTGDMLTDAISIEALERLRYNIRTGKDNDTKKYNIPESYKTELVFTINANSLMNLLNLRINKSALKEYRLLAMELFKKIPDEHKFLFIDNAMQAESDVVSYLSSIEDLKEILFRQELSSLTKETCTLIKEILDNTNNLTDIVKKYTLFNLQNFILMVIQWKIKS